MAKKIGLLTMFLVLFMLIIAACGGSATATPPSLPKPTSAIETLPVGHQLFVTKGCAACHGQDAEGSIIAPALGGHSGNQVRRQVRAPLGLMPVFPPDKISNGELLEIAGFIESLSGDHAHQRPAAKADALAQHHWMSLFALEDGKPSEAAHHINHVIELVTGSHLASMQEAIQLIESANLHDAEHMIEGMIAGTAAPDVTSPEMHLRLAASSAVVENGDDAIHHLEHYSALIDVDSPEAAVALEAMELLDAAEFSQAEHEISELVGGEGDGHDDDGDADAHQEDDGHDDGG